MFVSTPAEKRGSLVNFKLVNLNQLQVKDLSDDSHTELEVGIPHPDQIFFKGPSDIEIIPEVKNLILAINFTLKRACVTLRGSSVSDIRVNLKPNPNSSISSVIKNGKETQLNIHHSLSLRVSNRITIKGNETFDENEILSVFKKLQDFDTFGSPQMLNKGTNQNTNIKKALDEFSRAMETTDKQSKYKHFYNSLEFIVNFDGIERKGPTFKQEVKNLTNESDAKLELWHEFYNRFKHPDKSPENVKSFEQGIKDLSDILPDLKKYCSNIILIRL